MQDVLGASTKLQQNLLKHARNLKKSGPKADPERSLQNVAKRMPRELPEEQKYALAANIKLLGRPTLQPWDCNVGFQNPTLQSEVPSGRLLPRGNGSFNYSMV